MTSEVLYGIGRVYSPPYRENYGVRRPRTAPVENNLMYISIRESQKQDTILLKTPYFEDRPIFGEDLHRFSKFVHWQS